MMGIKDVTVEQQTIVITYDLLQATRKLIEQKLDEIGAELGGNWTERLSKAFIHESEEWEIGSLETKPHGHG